MRQSVVHVGFSYSAADDVPVVGGISRFGFVSMVRLNLVQSLARRGITVHVPSSGSENPQPPSENVRTGAPEFASILRRHRLDANMSQEALAERARISVNGLSSLERGTRRTPQRETLALLVEALDLKGEARNVFEHAARAGASASRAPGESNPTSDLTKVDLVVVVLTQAWLADGACRAQLENVIGAMADSPSRHILVVRREAVLEGLTLPVLSDCATFDFFRNDSALRAGDAFYRNDGTPIAAFYDMVEALSQAVARYLAVGSSTTSRATNPSGHVVFVAPPTDDMDAPYRTLVAELELAGYNVLPGSQDGSTLDDIDLALSSALCSIHLLGDEEAFDDAGRARVSFPLARAAARVRAGDGVFRRIVFAPKRSVDRGLARRERDPIEVRDRYAEGLTSDVICGDGITDFVLAAKDLIRAAERRAPVSSEPAALSPGNTVFVNFHPGDIGYARDVAKALRDRGLRARFAAFEDDKIANKITNAGRLRESHAVIHCWANASDAWLYAEAADYEDWRRLGRSEPFYTRAAVVGPPERGSKTLYNAQDPPEAIDVYVDLTMREAPLSEDLDPIVSRINAPRSS